MNFYMPVKVYAEENCILNHAAELASLGKRALIVTGKSSARRCGAFDDVTKALEQYGVSWVEFAEVETSRMQSPGGFCYRNRWRIPHGRREGDRADDKSSQ